MLESDGPNPIDLVALSRALGNLEATTEALRAGQEEIKESLRDTNSRFEETSRETNRRIEELSRESNRRFDEMTRRNDDANRRIDRLYYAVIGMGSALIIAVLASNFLGN
jgi:predicted nuclease with TOPRIM domain